jgi:hypothetical protein
MKLIQKLTILGIFFALFTGCATTIPRSSEDRVLIYGMIRGGEGSHSIKEVQLQGITDEGKRVFVNARFDVSGVYYAADLKPGRYALSTIVFDWGNGGTSTFPMQGKNTFFKNKADIKDGWDVWPGALFFSGGINLVMFEKDKKNYFRVEEDADATEARATAKLLKIFTKGPWHDLLAEKAATL